MGIAYLAYSSVFLNCLEGGAACEHSIYMDVALIRGASCRLKLFGLYCFEPQVLFNGAPYWLSLVSWLFVAKIGLTWSGVLLLHFCSCVLFSVRLFTRQWVRKDETPNRVSEWPTSSHHVINIFRACAMLVCLQLDEGQPVVLMMGTVNIQSNAALNWYTVV